MTIFQISLIVALVLAILKLLGEITVSWFVIFLIGMWPLILFALFALFVLVFTI
jgi:hypothetical protein